MSLRTIAKYAVQILVSTGSGSVITKSMKEAAPKSERFKIAEMTGSVAGYYVSETLKPQTDAIVDVLFDKYEAHKKH